MKLNFTFLLEVPAMCHNETSPSVTSVLMRLWMLCELSSWQEDSMTELDGCTSEHVV